MDPKAIERNYQWMTLHRDVEHIRRIAEAQNMHPGRAERGPYEVRAADTRFQEQQGALLRGTLERGNEIALEWNGNLMRLAEVETENGRILRALSQTADRSHAVLLDLRDIGTHSLTLLTASLGVQLDIERGVRQLQEIGIEQTRLQGLTIEEIREQGDLTRDEMGRQGALTRGEMARQAELIRAQDREIHKLLDQRLTQLGVLHRQDVTWLNQAMERRHQELYKLVEKLVDGVINPLLTQADERYRQAVDHQTTGHFDRALDALEELYKLDATHVPGRVLFGDIAQAHSVPEVARVAYAEAMAYARVGKNMEGLVAASLRLARLERAVGNHAAGLKAIQSALGVVLWDSPLCNVLRYEEIVAIYMEPDRTADLRKIARWLRNVLIADLSRRDQVAKDPFWNEVVAQDPYLRYGNAPYVRLAEIWMGLTGDWKPCTDPDVYPHAFTLCELGKKSHPQAVASYLRSLQEQVLDGRRPQSLAANEASAEAYEQLLLYVFGELYCAGKHEEAWQVLEQGSKPGLFLPRVAFEFFKRGCHEPATDEERVVRGKTVLRRILRAVPERRNVVASDEAFAAYRAVCPWLKDGNTQNAPLTESMAVVAFDFSDEEEAQVPQALCGSFHALRDLCAWIEDLLGPTPTGFVWRFGKDTQKVQALVNEVSKVVHACADRLTQDGADALLCVERWRAVMEEQYSRILLSVLMADPLNYGWEDDQEERLNLLLKLDPSARKLIEQSPFFARLREARAKDAERKLNEQRDRKRQEALRLAAEQAQREQQEALRAAEAAALREHWRRARLEAADALSTARSQLDRLQERLRYEYALKAAFDTRIKELLATSAQGQASLKALSDEAWTQWAQEQTAFIMALLEEITRKKEQDRLAAEAEAVRKRLQREREEAERRRVKQDREELIAKWMLRLILSGAFIAIAFPFYLYLLPWFQKL